MPVLFTSLRDERYTLPHLFERNALLKPDAPFLRYLDGDDENGPITDISAQQILQMASATVGHLGQLGCAPRQAGEPLKVVALYGTSGISYYTYLVACLLMKWTVRMIMSLYVCLNLFIPIRRFSSFQLETQMQQSSIYFEFQKLLIYSATGYGSRKLKSCKMSQLSRSRMYRPVIMFGQALSFLQSNFPRH